MNPTDPVLAVFVYGTLKRGQCREGCWPAEPLHIEKAWTRGELYDTGPYPALFAGGDSVAGELWFFSSQAIARVLKVLDRVEEYEPGCEATNLYNRVPVECIDRAGNVYRAYTYLYGRAEERKNFQRVEAGYLWGDRCFAVWPVGGDW